MLAFVAIAGVLGAVILPRSRHYSIAAGAVDYPRWGGMLRGRLILSEIDAFRREGRDSESASVVLLHEGRQMLLVPEDFLASPDAFLDTLRGLGVGELPPKFRRQSDAHG